MSDKIATMKEENLTALEIQLNSAKERSHQLERQLHDKERELKRTITELNDAHIINRQLQVRIDELREEISLYMPTTPSGNTALLMEFEFPICDSDENEHETPNGQDNGKLSNQNPDLNTNVLLEDMTSELTLRCYKSLLGSVSNCHQHLFELKQEMWQIYQQIQTNNSALRSYINNRNMRDARIKEKEDDDITKDRFEDDPVYSPSSISLSNALSTLSTLVQEIVKANENTNDCDNLVKEQLEKLIRERDEALSEKNFLEISLCNARLDVKSVNSQLLQAIQQKLAHQKELECWQEDMAVLVQRSLYDQSSIRRAKSLRNPKESNQEQSSSRFSLFVSSQKTEDGSGSHGSAMNLVGLSSQPGKAERSFTLNQSDKSTNFLTSWIRRKWNSSSSNESGSKSQNDI